MTGVQYEVIAAGTQDGNSDWRFEPGWIGVLVTESHDRL